MQILDENVDQNEFEKKCETEIFKFFAEIKTSNPNFNGIDRNRVRNAQGWIADEDMIEIDLPNRAAINVFVR